MLLLGHSIGALTPGQSVLILEERQGSFGAGGSDLL
jgi:hypothetical protein